MSHDDDACARWIEELRPALLRYARERLGGDRAEAEDVVQDASMRALVALRAGRAPANPRAWMFVIVRNRCHDVRSGRRAASPLDEAFDVSSAAPGPEEAAAARRQLGAVVDAIGALPDAQRRALVSATFEGRAYEEIAARESVSVQAVKSLVHRARQGVIASGARAAALMPAWPGALREQVAGLVTQHTATAASVAAVAVAVPVVPLELPQSPPPRAAAPAAATPAASTGAASPAAATTASKKAAPTLAVSAPSAAAQAAAATLRARRNCETIDLQYGRDC